jgi:hypothetical protein
LVGVESIVDLWMMMMMRWSGNEREPVKRGIRGVMKRLTSSLIVKLVLFLNWKNERVCESRAS